MQAIQATIKPSESGPEVANLQDALRLLLERAIIHSLEPPNQPSPDELAKLSDELSNERSQSRYGEATLRLVRILQIQQGLGDKPTREASSVFESRASHCSSFIIR